jgi:hypothetical protein
MAQTRDAPSHGSSFSHFRCEQAVIVDVNRATWTVTAQSIHSAKDFPDMPVLSPYAHHEGGAGFNHLPEVGAYCYVGIPSDNTPAFVMGYVPPPKVVTSEDSDPLRSTMSPEGSMTDVSYQANRPDSNPGDMGFTGRDGNFVIVSRGGVVQIGATSIAQRLYVPINNYIRDFAQNYEMSTVPGDLAWTVEPPELDSTGKAACQWVFHTRQYATDAKASIRVRYTPLSSPGTASKTAWEVTVAPQGIDTQTGASSGATYTLLVTMDGEKTELIGASRTVTITGDDNLTVDGAANWSIGTTLAVSAADIQLEAQKAYIAAIVSLGSSNAIDPAVKGTELIKWFATAQWVVSGTAATLSPASLATLQQILSTKVFVG